MVTAYSQTEDIKEERKQILLFPDEYPFLIV